MDINTYYETAKNIAIEKLLNQYRFEFASSYPA